MKRLTLIIVLCSVGISIIGQTRLISVEDAQVIANRNAAIKWGNVSPADPIIYYSADDKVVAYRFNYAINKPFPDKNTVLQECAEGKQDGNRKAQWGNGNYGNILMSARTDLPVNLEHGLGISSEFAYNEYLHEQAEAHLGPNYSLERIYYINAVNIWHHYTNGSKDIYVKAHSPAKVGDYEVFQTAISEYKFFCETGDYNNQWDQYLYGKKGMSKAEHFIINHDECCPFYDWSYGCSPTAGAMLFGYWDHLSMYSNWNFSKFVDYHFERTDNVPGGSCVIDSHCPNVMAQLATAMGTNLSTGSTPREDIAPGYNTVAANNGYYFGVEFYDEYTPAWYIAVIMYEIDHDAPLHVSIEGHSILAVGYNDDSDVATHYTHQPWVVWITYGQLQAVYPTNPVFGGTDLGIEIIKPDGDQDYYGNGSGETMYAGDVYEITWDYDPSPGSYVSLYYSTDHGSGSSWELITLNTPNDGVYDWVIPVGINSNDCRIKINVYTSDGSYEGSDGSYGDFQINPGGSIYTLFSDSKVTTITTPDYYQFNNPNSTWCAVGVRPNSPLENWSVRMFSNQIFTTELISSTTSDPVDFVVMDSHHTGSFTKGIKTYQTIGLDDASVEFEGDQETLTVGTSAPQIWPNGDVVEMFDVYLTPGVYGFQLDLTTGSGDLDFGLFGSTDGIYYKNKESFLAHSTNYGAAVDEYFTFAVTTSDYYGLCVWANDGNSSSYTIDIHDPDPGTWEGDNSPYWGDANNWSLGIFPDASTDIIIPAGTLFDCTLSYGSASCNSLTVSSAAVLNINGQSLTINNDMSIDGSIGMLQDNSYINIYGDVEWNAGSALNVSSNSTYINVYGDWNFNEGANVNPGLGFVDFRGTSTKYIRCFSDNCSFYKLRNYKTGGAVLGLSAQNTEQLEVFMLTYLNAGTIFNSYSSQGMLMKGSFNYYGTFDFNTGSVTFDGTDIRQFSTGSGTFNNVIFNSTGGSHMINGDMTVTGDLTIEQGYFSPDTNTVFVAGDWINNVGTGGFIPGTGRVTFNGGNYHQYCSNETFNILEINKPLGGAFRINGTDVVCAAYDWTAGAVDVLSGSFTANSLLDNGISGAFYLNTDGTIDLNAGGWVDLNGELHIFGGTMTVTGTISEWPYSHNALIEMSGGVLDFTDCGITVANSPTYSLTENITGGIIRTAYGFSGNRADFTPTSGIFEFYGTGDGTLYQSNGCTLNTVHIDKATKESSMPYQTYTSKTERIDLTKGNGSKVNNISLASDFVVTNYLSLNSGSLTLNSYDLTVMNDCDIYGTLNMTNAGDVLNVGDAAYDNLAFRSGSFGNLTAGVVNASSWVWVDVGGSVTATTGNTINFNGPGITGIEVDEAGSVFGNINIISVSPFRFYSFYGNTIEVDGDFNLQAGNSMELMNNTVVVHGNFTDAATSTIYVYDGPVADGGIKQVNASGELENQTMSEIVDNTKNPDDSGAKGGYLEIDTDFILNGLMDVGDGNVYVHGHYDQESTATLSIGSGSFICDGPTTAYCSVYGILNLIDGLFEISNNHLRLNALCSISGGTIRSGGTFWASLDGNFQPAGGVVELIGTGASGQYISVHANNYFHDLTINRTNTIQIYTGYDLDVRNDFTILSGGLNTNSLNMYVGGNWDNMIGTDAFLEGTGKVVFNKSTAGMQYINSDEHFNIIENNTTDAIRVNSSQDTVECNSYNWISGGVSVYAGAFIANDLAQPGIYGNWFALTGSKIHLYQDAQYLDMFGDRFYINGGLIRVYGGQDVSYWCSSSALDVDITSGGVLDFVDIGINIWETQPLTYDLSGGTIQAGGHFTCRRTDFNPTGGTFEFHGGADSYINVYSGSVLDNVIINKSGGDKSTYSYKDRDGKTQTNSKSNRAYLITNGLDITGNLDVDAGTFDINGLTLNCYGDININNGGILDVNDNSTLALDAGSYLHANSGGVFQIVGSPGNEAQITHVSSSLYWLWIEDGGTISAEHALFEYMAYVYLRPGSTIDPVHSFHYCTFQEGSAGNALMVFYNTQTLQINNAIFPTNTWGGPYNVRNISIGDVTFYNATGGFAGPEYENDDYNTIHWATDTYEVDLEVFLEGPFNVGTTKMDLDLNNQGLIPTSQPFNSIPLADWYYTGSESVASIPDFVVDWVLVQLRDAPNIASALPGRVIATQAGFVLNTGEVVGLDGLNALDFNAAVYNNLYVNIWHRNHLGVISANPLVNVAGTYTYNFFSGSGQAYGGTSAQKQLSPGIWGILSGDANGNGDIEIYDKYNIWDIQAGETGYKAGDYNLDSQINNQDKNDQWVPNFGAGSFIPE